MRVISIIAGNPKGRTIKDIPMRAYPRLIASIIAAALFAVSLPTFAKGGGGDDGPDGSHPGNGGHHGPPATLPGIGHHDVTAHPPQGVCADDSNTAIDVQGPAGQSGASQVAHTNFGLVDPATGNSVPSEESATMMYFWFGSTFDYVLNAHALPAGSQWTLTYQPEPLPSSGALCLGEATVNGGGQLHLTNSIELNSNLPPALDPTADPSTQPPDALLALVPSADVDCTGGTMTNFEPAVYLWSNPRVRYVDTDLLPAVQ
ncbi:MAG TPA: hypothetical protein VL425_05170 [Rudaea sp.]|nr:hypothetical protein [Rudaea sp.]